MFLRGRCQASAVVVAYATASESLDAGDAVGITLSQFIPASQQPQQQQQVDVSLQFVSIPLLSRSHQLYHWTRCAITMQRYFL